MVRTSVMTTVVLVQTISDLEGPDAGWQGFHTPLLVRFLGVETAYLSFVASGPAFCVYSEDMVTPSSAQENPWLKVHTQFLPARIIG